MVFRLSHAIAAAASLVVAGCADPSPPVAPAAPMPPAPPPATAPQYPVLTRAAVIYMAADSLYHSGDLPDFGGSSLSSRYVLYEDGTFALQFLTVNRGFLEYLGRYASGDSLIAFDWDASYAARPWAATGTVHGDSLRVAYNVVMQLTDFEDGLYVRVPGTP